MLPAGPPPIPHDPDLPAARGLFAADGAAALHAFLGDRGWSMEGARPVQVLYRPGRSCVVRFLARAENREGRPRLVTLSAETRARPRPAPPPPPGLGERYGLPDPAAQVPPYLVWAFPYDPSLPGLPDAVWGPAVRRDLTAAGRRCLGVQVDILRYRPRQRAVIRYAALSRGRERFATDSLYAKVLRPGAAERGLRTAAAARAGRGPRCPRLTLGWPEAATAPGTLVTAAVPGRCLRDLLLEGGSLPSLGRVAGILDDLPAAAPLDLQADGSSPAEVARSTGAMLRRIVPGTADDVDRVVGAVERGSGEGGLPARVVHGDLYEAQILVGEQYALGLIDLDDLGPGDPALDAANLSAHLLALALSVPGATPRLLAYRALVREAFLDRLRIAPSDLAWREALAMLLLATGPFRVCDPEWPAQVARRVRLAVRLLERA